MYFEAVEKILKKLSDPQLKGFYLKFYFLY
jgi:hypothetical protein